MALAHPVLEGMNLRLQQQLICGDFENVYHAVLEDDGRHVLVLIRSYMDRAQFIQASLLAERHSQIVNDRLLTYVCHRFITTLNCRYELAIVVEWGEKALWTEITERSATSTPYPESYLRLVYSRLVDCFAHLQKQKVTRLHVSPWSLFLTSEGVKLATFGAPACCGDEFFLSPAQKLYYRNPQLPLFENPYKSAVFMLGTCLLSMAMLNAPNLQSDFELSRTIEGALAAVLLSDTMKARLRLMLNIQEFARPDFLRLQREPLPELAEVIVSIPSLSKPSGPCCLQCDISISSSDKNLWLWCGVGEHGFCSWKCTENYTVAATNRFKLDISAVTCKRCGAGVAKENLEECMGGESNLRTLREQTLSDKPLCAACHRTGEQTYQLACGCWFCIGDIKTFHTHVLKFKNCGYCNNKLELKQLREIINSVQTST